MLDMFPGRGGSVGDVAFSRGGWKCSWYKGGSVGSVPSSRRVVSTMFWPEGTMLDVRPG